MKTNRLKLMRFYLVGPMDHDREGGRQWRIDIAKWLKARKAIPIDPYHKPLLPIHNIALEDDDSHRLISKAVEEKNDSKIRELVKPIVHTDLRIVDHCDAIICYLDKDKYPCGSFDEIFEAANQNKPVLIYCPQGKYQIHRWLWGRLPYQLFFNSWDEVKEYLRHIDEDPDEEIDLMGRWKFFDWEPVIREVLND